MWARAFRAGTGRPVSRGRCPEEDVPTHLARNNASAAHPPHAHPIIQRAGPAERRRARSGDAITLLALLPRNREALGAALGATAADQPLEDQGASEPRRARPPYQRRRKPLVRRAARARMWRAREPHRSESARRPASCLQGCDEQGRTGYPVRLPGEH